MPHQPGTDGSVLRLVTFSHGISGSTRLGAVTAQGMVVDLGATATATGMTLAFDPMSMVSLIAAGPDAVAQARHCADLGHPYEPLDRVRLLAPISVPARNIYAVGWNYLEHFGERLTAKKADLPKHPVFFTKGTHTINGPYDPIPFDHSVSTRIGGQRFKGKSLDGHGPIGPWIIPASDIDYTNLQLTTRVNGVVKQQINTSHMYFKVPRLIAELSLGLTLEPGDIIATGTPSGIGAARNPPEFLKPGDVMETEIDRIGVIRNVIRRVGS